ncbi:MAG: hypothetical protein J7J96_08585 [Sulfurimonas sp.]|nr:hypothetical protein [Sulfurimonas sp.]
MKYLIISMILSLFVYAGEMDRIESIVKDIEVLRADYNKCTQELDINNIQNNEKSNKKCLKLLKIKEKENIYLKNRLDIQNEELKSKDKIINNLKNQINSKNKIFENANKFPKLMMKDSKKEKKVIKEVEVNLKASTFKLLKDSDIYNSVNGEVIYQWKANSAFTSNKMTQNWMKITGYFIDNKWKRAPGKLWIKKINIVKR